MLVLGVDPGRGKIGWALTGCNGGLFLSGICPITEQGNFLNVLLTCDPASWERGLSSWVTELPEKPKNGGPRREIFLIAVGNGTGSPEAVKLFERLGVQVVVVDESGSTLEAGRLYWTLHSPSWFQKFLPRAMRMPPRPLDDLAAWVIARRSLENL